MDRNEVRAVSETITNLKKLDIRKKPMSTVATTIFMITQLSRRKRNLVDTSMATNVNEATILSTDKMISAFTPQTVPQKSISTN